MSALLTRWRRIAVTGLLAGGLAAGTALVAVPAEAATVKNLMTNGSAESVSRQIPKGWAKGGSGSNIRQLSSVSKGAQSGKRFARVKITKRVSGSAWWFSPAASVRAGSSYTFTEYYRSAARTTVNAYFTVNGKVVGQQLGVLPPSTRWKSARFAVKAPAGATKVRFATVLSSVGYLDVDNLSLVTKPGTPPATSGTPKPPTTAASTRGIVSLTFDDGWTNQYTNAYPIMKAAGNMPGTFYLISGAVGAGEYMTVAQAKQIQQSGSEIGSHSVTHANLMNVDNATLTNELANSKSALEANFGPITSLAYPYGAGDPRVQTEAAKYYSNARSTNPGLMAKGQFNRYSLTIGYVLNTTPLSTVQNWINEAKANNTWLVLCYHQIQDGKPDDTYTISVSTFRSHVDALKASGVRVATVRDAYAAMS